MYLMSLLFTECTDGTYGYNCNNTCGNCIYGAACDKFTGSCLEQLPSVLLQILFIHPELQLDAQLGPWVPVLHSNSLINLTVFRIFVLILIRKRVDNIRNVNIFH
jgi:hypothetical protein